MCNELKHLVGLDYAASVESNARLCEAMRAIIATHYYRNADLDWLKSDEGLRALNYEGIWRYTNACRWVVPWACKHCDLAAAAVADIGAGTGATTAAFAHVAKRVSGYEIEQRSVEAAADRFRVLGIANASVAFANPEDQICAVERDFPQGTDVVLLFAVLEHLTQSERLQYLERIWTRLLKPGGYLIVVDTPNRLTYYDYHTSEMPFFHLLPPELALRYFSRSRRAEFVNGLSTVLRAHENATEALHRWGLGASYHEFEIAFGCDLDGLIVANGFEWEMTNWFPPKLEDELLIRYFLDRDPDHDLGFARSVLNLIFRKPLAGERPVHRPRIDPAHLDVLISYHRLDSRLKLRLS